MRVSSQKKFSITSRSQGANFFFSRTPFCIKSYISRLLTLLFLKKPAAETTRAMSDIVSRRQPWRSTFYSVVSFFEGSLIFTSFTWFLWPILLYSTELQCQMQSVSKIWKQCVENRVIFRYYFTIKSRVNIKLSRQCYIINYVLNSLLISQIISW